MTIQFNCPNCNAIIAFADKHCGKRARCTTCGQLLIIPSKSNETSKKVEPPKEKGQVLPGFYLNIIYETAFEIDKLPEIYLGTSITFLWYIIKPFFLFSVTMAVVQLPCIIWFIMLKEQGLLFEDILQSEFGLLHVLFIFGLFYRHYNCHLAW